MFAGIENDGYDKVIMDYDLKRYHDRYLVPVESHTEAMKNGKFCLHPKSFGGEVHWSDLARQGSSNVGDHHITAGCGTVVVNPVNNAGGLIWLPNIWPHDSTADSEIGSTSAVREGRTITIVNQSPYPAKLMIQAGQSLFVNDQIIPVTVASPYMLNPKSTYMFLANIENHSNNRKVWYMISTLSNDPDNVGHHEYIPGGETVEYSMTNNTNVEASMVASSSGYVIVNPSNTTGSVILPEVVDYTGTPTASQMREGRSVTVINRGTQAVKVMPHRTQTIAAGPAERYNTTDVYRIPPGHTAEFVAIFTPNNDVGQWRVVYLVASHHEAGLEKLHESRVDVAPEHVLGHNYIACYTGATAVTMCDVARHREGVIGGGTVATQGTVKRVANRTGSLLTVHKSANCHLRENTSNKDSITLKDGQVATFVAGFGYAGAAVWYIASITAEYPSLSNSPLGGDVGSSNLTTEYTVPSSGICVVTPGSVSAARAKLPQIIDHTVTPNGNQFREGQTVTISNLGTHGAKVTPHAGQFIRWGSAKHDGVNEDQLFRVWPEKSVTMVAVFDSEPHWRVIQESNVSSKLHGVIEINANVTASDVLNNSHVIMRGPNCHMAQMCDITTDQFAGVFSGTIARAGETRRLSNHSVNTVLLRAPQNFKIRFSGQLLDDMTLYPGNTVTMRVMHHNGTVVWQVTDFGIDGGIKDSGYVDMEVNFSSSINGGRATTVRCSYKIERYFAFDEYTVDFKSITDVNQPLMLNFAKTKLPTDVQAIWNELNIQSIEVCTAVACNNNSINHHVNGQFWDPNTIVLDMYITDHSGAPRMSPATARFVFRAFH